MHDGTESTVRRNGSLRFLAVNLYMPFRHRWTVSSFQLPGNDTASFVGQKPTVDTKSYVSSYRFRMVGVVPTKYVVNLKSHTSNFARLNAIISRVTTCLAVFLQVLPIASTEHRTTFSLSLVPEARKMPMYQCLIKTD